MKQMESYTAFLTENADLVIVIPLVAQTQADQPKILYDGKEHALFYRRPDDVIILDYLNEIARAAMMQSSRILIFEIDEKKQTIVSDYFASVIITDKLPAFELPKKVEDFTQENQ